VISVEYFINYQLCSGDLKSRFKIVFRKDDNPILVISVGKLVELKL